MTDSLNLDIITYNKNDLLKLFNCDLDHSKDDITIAYNNKLRSVNSISDTKIKNKLKPFIDNAFKKLIKLIKPPDETSVDETSIINNIKTYHHDPAISKMHPEPNIMEPPIKTTFPIQYPLGNINPIEKKTTSEIFCIDTLFRDMKKYPEGSDFVYTLPAPLENIISMKLISAEIPNIQYLFSTQQRNNKLIIKMFNGKSIETDQSGAEVLVDFPPEGKTLEITLHSGSPVFTTLINTIQSNLNNQRNSFSFLHVGIDDINGRFFFRFKTLVECIEWNNRYYKPNSTQNVIPPDNKPPTAIFKMPSVKTDSQNILQYDYLKRIYLGETESSLRGISNATDDISYNLVNPGMLKYEIDFNPYHQEFTRSLGWLLGFRNREWIDDFKCKPTELYSHGEYSNPKLDSEKHTVMIDYDNFFIRDDISFHGYYTANTAYGDNEQNYLYLYVNDFVGNYNDTLNAALVDSFLAKSLLARIQIRGVFFSVEFIENSMSQISILEKNRNYFGPVNIKKLHIKLLDKYGNVIHIGNTNYSLTFQFEKLYSSIRN